MNCANCGFTNDPDAGFCENCGSPLMQSCPNCGAQLKPGARFCKRCGEPVSARVADDRLAALRHAAPPELQQKIHSASHQVLGERKPVTILFTDIVGSTALAEKLDPEEWKEIVSGAHQRVSQAVYRYEGAIAQLLGDGVLAFFGAPVTHEDDPLRAVLAALDIQHAMAEYERQLEGYLESFKMRIGLNTGMVVVGSVGNDLHMEYLAIGDAVNLAARLQSAAQPGQVLISGSTAGLVEAAFTLQPLGEISIKGKTEPVAVYAVSESRSLPESRRGYLELYSPLVGREAELAGLSQAFEQLRAGLGQVVSITGEAGIGKSRLVEEACRLAGADGPDGCPLRMLEGRALSYGQKLSFWMIQQLIQDDLGLSDGDPELKVRLALRRRAQALFGESAGQVLPYLGSLLGVQLESEQAERLNILDGETLKHQTLLSITHYFSRLAEEQPVVLIFDDLHWADPSSLEALERLLPLTDRAPLMLLMLSRLEREHASWNIKFKAESEYSHRYTGIELKPLTAGEQNDLVDNLLAIADLPELVRERILERAEGNPLFLEEIVRCLVEQGAIIQEGWRWRATSELLEIAIPETLRGVLLARIDRLQEDVRRTLQLAAVIGKSFLFKLLAAISEAEEELEIHLARLQRADLVREKARLPELEYTFKHSLTQEAAYHSLLHEQRREYHRRLGLALETLFADRQEELTGLLAHHFDAAGERDRAIGYLVRAGDKARLSDEHMEAVGYYQRAIELLAEAGEGKRCAQTWLKLGLVYHANFQFEAAFQAYEQAFALEPKVDPAGRITGEGKTLRICLVSPVEDRYDPGLAMRITEGFVIGLVFSGLAKVDDELNVIPDVARSWQALDGGKRYLFHLRDDVRWTDGSPVTAFDFEWAWKRNLHPSNTRSAVLLYAVSGAQEYHEGLDPNPDHVQVRALDAFTLEVMLVKPVAYFLYTAALGICFPLPRGAIETHGSDWWRPGRIVSNGAFRLVDYDQKTGIILEHNPGYHGDLPGNVHRMIVTGYYSSTDRLRAYQENQADITEVRLVDVPGDTPPEQKYANQELSVYTMMVNPLIPPFGDVRVRRALAMGLDREQMFQKTATPPIYGGLIPPGMPGHSPDIGFHFDHETARRLLAEAGCPDGAGLPVFRGYAFEGAEPYIDEMVSQWQAELGIRFTFDFGSSPERDPNLYALSFFGWIADFPDPESFISQFFYMNQLGWQVEEIQELIGRAGSLPDRRQRMALYRQADRLLVAEQVIMIPLGYSNARSTILVKPWIKNYHVNLLGRESIEQVVVEDH